MKNIRIERQHQRRLQSKPIRRNRTLTDVGSSIHSLAISADGKRAVSWAALTGDLRAWDLARGECVWQKHDYDHAPGFADISADGRLVLSAGFGCKLWDFQTAEVRSLANDMQSPAALSNDGTTAVAVVSDEQTKLRVWDVNTGEEEWTLDGFVVQIWGLAINHDGTQIAVTDHDGIRLFDVTRRKRLWENASTPAAFRSYPYSNPTFSGDGGRLAACHLGQHVEIWDAANGERSCCLGSGAWLGDIVHCVALNENGTRIVTGMSRVFKPDGACEPIGIWNTVTENMEIQHQLAGILEGHESGIISIAIDSKARTVISGDDRGIIKVWDIGARTFNEPHHRYQTQRIDAVDQLDWDGLALIFDGECCSHPRLQLRDVESGECIQSLNADAIPDQLYAVRLLDPHTALLAYRDFDDTHTLSAMRLEDGECEWTVRDGDMPWLLDQSGSGTIAFGQTKDYAQLHLFTGDPEPFETFAGPGSRISVIATDWKYHECSTIVAGTDEGTLVVWDTVSKKARLILKGHRGAITSVDMIRVRNALLAISGCEDGTARVWDLETGDCLQNFNDHQSGRLCVALSRNGAIAVTAGMDTTVRVWDVTSGECVDWYKAGEPVTCLSRVDWANHLVCGTLCGDVHFLTIRNLAMPVPDDDPPGLADARFRDAHFRWVDLVLKERRPIGEAMQGLIDEQQAYWPDATDWNALRRLDFRGDFDVLTQWLEEILANEPPPKRINGLTFELLWTEGKHEPLSAGIRLFGSNAYYSDSLERSNYAYEPDDQLAWDVPALTALWRQIRCAELVGKSATELFVRLGHQLLSMIAAEWISTTCMSQRLLADAPFRAITTWVPGGYRYEIGTLRQEVS